MVSDERAGESNERGWTEEKRRARARAESAARSTSARSALPQQRSLTRSVGATVREVGSGNGATVQ